MRSSVRTRVLARACAAVCGTIVTAHAARAQSAHGAQGDVPLKEEKPGLLRQATVTPDAARRAALARVPNGRVAEQEVEREHGKLVYSFDIAVPGKRGIEEVLVDARTGAVLSQEHETPKRQAAERAQDAREAKRKTAGAKAVAKPR